MNGTLKPKWMVDEAKKYLKMTEEQIAKASYSALFSVLMKLRDARNGVFEDDPYDYDISG